MNLKRVVSRVGSTFGIAMVSASLVVYQLGIGPKDAIGFGWPLSLWSAGFGVLCLLIGSWAEVEGEVKE